MRKKTFYLLLYRADHWFNLIDPKQRHCCKLLQKVPPWSDLIQLCGAGLSPTAPTGIVFRHHVKLYLPFVCFSSITVFVFVHVFVFLFSFLDPISFNVEVHSYHQRHPALLFLRTLSLFLSCLVLNMSLSFSILFPWFDIILICRLIWPCLHIFFSRLGQVCSAGISPTATALSPMVLFQHLKRGMNL